jgi:hypothetical protein
MSLFTFRLGEFRSMVLRLLYVSLLLFDLFAVALPFCCC